MQGLTSLQVENMETLSKNNDCKYCGGVGFVHPIINGKVQYDRTVLCTCQKEEAERNKKESLFRLCAFPPKTETMTFKEFKPYKAVATALKIAKNIASNPGKLVWLTLLGQNGVGKTHLAVAICKAWVAAGIPTRYVYVPTLLDELKEGFGRIDDKSYNKRFKSFCNVPLLLLDDLGQEYQTAWVQEKLNTLVDYRLMNKLSLIITCNKSLDELSPSIASRLSRLHESYVVNIDAEDYLLNKVEELK